MRGYLGVIEAVLIISVTNLALQLLACWQRHLTLREARRGNGRVEPYLGDGGG